MTVIARFTSVLLVALVLMTAQSAAVARTMPDATGQMTLCTGTGPTMVYMDAQGNPTGPPHICPEYALSLILALDTPVANVTATGRWISLVVPEPVHTLAMHKRTTARARGPPRLV